MAVAASVALSACAPAAPPQPAPYVVKLNEMCQAGDASACGTLVAADHAATANRIAAVQSMQFPVMQTTRPAPIQQVYVQPVRAPSAYTVTNPPLSTLGGY